MADSGTASIGGNVMPSRRLCAPINTAPIVAAQMTGRRTSAASAIIAHPSAESTNSIVTR